jgi:phosphatidylinositol glycan class B
VLAASFALACALNIVLDNWLYGAWVNTPYNYFHANLVEGKAAMFGTQPWWFYFTQMLAVLVPPFSLVLVGLLGAGMWLCRRNVLVWAVLPFVIGHTVLGHKEVRFLIPITYALVPLLVFAAAHYRQGAGGIIAAFVLGGIFTAFYVRFRDLLANITAHFLGDFVLNVVLPLLGAG